VFFLVSGLALVGLPGTLGYLAEDLLFHGALESAPVIGLALHMATALNAIHLFRLFSRLFLGRLGSEIAVVPDALARERLPLTCCILFLVVAGLIPGPILRHREPVAERIHAALESSEQQTH
jgi:NADH:ubiquinone oxidoreductase subunit 4 (subunit M)